MATFLNGMFGGASLAKAMNGTETAIHLVRGGALNVVVTILIWQARARERHALSSMDDRLLRDMGLTRGDVSREVSKRLWEA